MQSTWGRSIPCCCKVAAARGKCGLGKVANIDWHEIPASVIKNATCRPESQISKIATCPLLYHLPTRSNTPPAAAGGERRGGHTPAPLVCRRAREVGRQRCRRPRVVPIHCTVERATLGTKDGNPWVGVRTGARHADGRYTDMIWKGVSREARLALLNIKTDNKTISQIYFTVKYI